MACLYRENNLVTYRNLLGVSQSVLAAAVGVSTNTICSIERQHFMPSLLLAYKLADYFGVSIEDLFVPWVGGDK